MLTTEAYDYADISFQILWLPRISFIAAPCRRYMFGACWEIQTSWQLLSYDWAIAGQGRGWVNAQLGKCARTHKTQTNTLPFAYTWRWHQRPLSYQSVEFSGEKLSNLTPNIAPKLGWLQWFNTGVSLSLSVCLCVYAKMSLCAWFLQLLLRRSITQQ